LGNWKTFQEDDDATLDWDVLDQDRLHNKVNEIDNDDNHANAPGAAITGGSWIVPGYDAAGNMLSGPKPTDPTVRQHYVWDAWNRMVAVYADDDQNPGNPGDLIEEYRYDALNRRIAKVLPDPENEDKYVRTDYYHSPRGQVVEERYAANLADKETLATARKYQYVWGIRYIHAAVLRDADTNSDGDVLDQGGSERLYYTQDANFNVTALIGRFRGHLTKLLTRGSWGGKVGSWLDWLASSPKAIRITSRSAATAARTCSGRRPVGGATLNWSWPTGASP